MESGVDSSEAFSRAFKSVYQISPTAYRKNCLDVFPGNKKEIDRDFLRHISANITVQPQIRKIDDIYVAGIHGTAALDNIFALWQQFGEKQDSIPNKHPSSRTFGICEYQKDADIANYDMKLSEVIGGEVVTYDNLPTGKRNAVFGLNSEGICPLCLHGCCRYTAIVNGYLGKLPKLQWPAALYTLPIFFVW